VIAIVYWFGWSISTALALWFIRRSYTDGVRDGRLEADKVTAATYAAARREGFAAGYESALEDEGK
jgi:hypothetical protein